MLDKARWYLYKTVEWLSVELARLAVHENSTNSVLLSMLSPRE